MTNQPHAAENDAPAQMQVHVTHHYAENRGDHAADAVQAHHYDPDETVAAMLARVMGFPVSRYRQPDPTAFVTLRVVTGTEPREADDGTPPF